MPTEVVQIFVELAGEGVPCWRPVRAVPLGGVAYRIAIDQLIPDDENWAFAPGDIVSCENRSFQDGVSGLVAIRKSGVAG